MAKDFQTLSDSRLFDDVDDAIRAGKVPFWYRNVLRDNQLVEPHQVLPALFAEGNYNFDNGLVANLYHSFARFDHQHEARTQNSIYFDTDYTPLFLILRQASPLLTLTPIV